MWGSILIVRAKIDLCRRGALGLFPALVLTACASASMPTLGGSDSGSGPSPTATVQPGEPNGGARTKSEHVPGVTEKGGLRVGAGTGVLRVPQVGDTANPGLITGFKGTTVVLFGDETGNDGERIAVSSLSLPLQTKSSAANASRVQIQTAYGARWVARSELLFGGAPRPPTGLR